MVKDKIQSVKNHILEHKVVYCSLGSGVLFAGITVLIMRSVAVQGGASENDAQGGLINTASLIFRNQQTINVTTVLDRDGRGHPGWPVRNLETKRVFFSQKEAADAFGVPEGLISGHIKGKFENVDGLHFERVNLA